MLEHHLLLGGELHAVLPLHKEHLSETVELFLKLPESLLTLSLELLSHLCPLLLTRQRLLGRSLLQLAVLLHDCRHAFVDALHDLFHLLSPLGIVSVPRLKSLEHFVLDSSAFFSQTGFVSLGSL